MNPQHSAAEIKPKLRDFDEIVAVTRGSLCSIFDTLYGSFL